MPVPDHVYFGPGDNGDGLNYGQIRALEEDKKFAALKRRFDVLFLLQVGELGKFEGGKIKVYSPFPLFLMTCVGIETVGKIFFTRSPKQNESEEDVQRLGFLEVCKGIHGHFSRPLNKKQKEEYDGLWGPGEHRKVDSISHIIYRFGRHTMVHGYRGKGVYLTDDASIPEWKMVDGAVVINPYWFWSQFVEHSTRLWKEFYANKEPTNPLKASARKYLQELLE